MADSNEEVYLEFEGIVDYCMNNVPTLKQEMMKKEYMMHISNIMVYNDG